MIRTHARLQRLLAIRRLSENIESVALKRIVASVSEVEIAIEQQRVCSAQSKLASQGALSRGDRSEWLLADVQNEVAGWNQTRLIVLLQARSVHVRPAMERFLESRRQCEQVRQLVDYAQKAAGSEAERKEQSAADDWYLSRRARPVD
jgi:flagellar biosynthesis chaperone FliJ